MLKKSVLLCCIFVLILLLASTIKSSTNDEMEESSDENSEIEEIEIEQGEIEQGEDNNNGNNGTIMRLYPQQYYEAIITEIINGSRNTLPRNLISQIIQSSLILELLATPLGARLAAERYAEIFTCHLAVILNNAISEEFFRFLDIFNVENEGKIFIPNEIIGSVRKQFMLF